MMPIWRSASSHMRSVRPRVDRLARIGGEAGLVAAVALGVAQLAWRLLTPMPAVAAVTPLPPDTPSADERALEVSPFAPFAAAGVSAAAPDAAFSGVTIVGVRLAAPADRSSVVLSLPEGRQRALMVGQELAAGLVLTLVAADHAEFTYNGQRKDLVFATAEPRPSLALSLMQGRPARAGSALGLAGAPYAAEPTTLPPTPLPTAPPPAPLSPAGADEAGWLAATLSSRFTREDGAAAWRAAPHPPAAVAHAGLEEGDVILAINGRAASEADLPQLVAQLAAAGSAPLSLTVETKAGQRRQLSVAVDAS